MKAKYSAVSKVIKARCFGGGRHHMVSFGESNITMISPPQAACCHFSVYSILLLLFLAGTLCLTSAQNKPAQNDIISIASTGPQLPNADLIHAFLALGSSAFTLLHTFNEVTRRKKELSSVSGNSLLSDPDSTCKLCDSSITALLVLYYEKKFSEEKIKDLTTAICIMLQFQPEDVCKGLIDINLDVLFDIGKRRQLTAKEICGTIFERYSCYGPEPIVDWEVYFNLSDTTDNSCQEKGTSKSSTIKIVHLTDPHLEVNYTKGANAECGKPMCCRKDQCPANSSETAAGEWGDYRYCDSPWKVIENTLHTVKSTHKDIKYIYMTGDLVDHNVWDTTQEYNMAVIKQLGDYFIRTLSPLKLFPSIGNHESHPANVFAPPEITGEFSSDWIYKTFCDAWCKYLPEEAKKTFLHGGYYSVSPEPGFRIVAINTMYGNEFNWWSIYDPVDPAGHLQWLAETLQGAEQQGEKVHIIGHIPPNENLKVWSREYKRILDRFSCTVTAQFFGHTHRDQFYVTFIKNSTTPNGVGFGGGSITTYNDVNPNYRIYTVDEKTWEVKDFDTYIFNLTEANLHPVESPKWYKLYSFLEAYGVQSLRPHDLSDLVDRLATDRILRIMYHRYFYKDGDAGINTKCDDDCQKKRLCNIVTSSDTDLSQCERIINIYKP